MTQEIVDNIIDDITSDMQFKIRANIEEVILGQAPSRSDCYEKLKKLNFDQVKSIYLAITKYWNDTNV